MLTSEGATLTTRAGLFLRNSKSDRQLHNVFLCVKVTPNNRMCRCRYRCRQSANTTYIYSVQVELIILLLLVMLTSRQHMFTLQTVVSPTTNVCTSTNVANNNIFFPYIGDNTKFIQCSGVNKPLVLSCPSLLVYDSNRQSCVLPGGTNVGTVTNPPVSGGVIGGNTGTNTGNACMFGLTVSH